MLSGLHKAILTVGLFCTISLLVAVRRYDRGTVYSNAVESRTVYSEPVDSGKVYRNPVDSTTVYSSLVGSRTVYSKPVDSATVYSNPVGSRTVYNNSVTLPSLRNRAGTIFSSTLDVEYSITNPKHWIPDWALNDNISEVIATRKRDIMRRCEELAPYTNPWKKSPRSLIVKGHHLSLCTTAKGGSTFWKSFMKLYKIREMPATPELPDTRFIVTRNPWHRLVSAWNDKVVTEDKKILWMKNMCKGRTWPDHPTFSEFVEHCVVRRWEYNRMYDNHWVPVIDRCKICQPDKRVDLFIAAENMNEEGEYMLKTYGGLTDPQPILDMSKKMSIRETEAKKDTLTYQSHYLNVSKEHINILKEIYKYENILFQYPDTPFVDFDKS